MTDQKEKTDAGTQEAESRKRNGSRRAIRHGAMPYGRIVSTALLILVIGLAVFFCIYRYEKLAAGMQTIVSSLTGVIMGLILAYLLNPLMKFVERSLKKSRLAKREVKNEERRRMVFRAISTISALVIFLAIIVVLLLLIIPSFVATIQDLYNSMGDMVNTVSDWITRLTKSGSQIGELLQNALIYLSEYLNDWISETFSENGTELLVYVTSGVYSVAKFLLNVIVALIVAVYVLMRKETFVGQIKKLIYAVFPTRWGNIAMEVLQKADDAFGGFFIGKIIDSIIIGFLCFAIMYIVKLPYAVFVSLIIGVTNIIPFFGPFIGGIPCIILIFLNSPIQGLYFAIIVLALQQFDGNILGPKILGNSTGLSPFWVIVACVLFGGLFGIAGMIFGVPTFAVIYYVIKRLAEHFLRKRKLPVETADYVDVDRVNEKTNTVILKTEEQRQAEKRKNAAPVFGGKWRKKRAAKEDTDRDDGNSSADA